MPKYVTRRGRPRNQSEDLPDLFSWHVTTITPDRAARKLVRRFGFSLATAATVARLAGIGSAVES